MNSYTIPNKKLKIFDRENLYKLYDNDVRNYKITFISGYLGTGKTFSVLGWYNKNKEYEESEVYYLDCRGSQNFLEDWYAVNQDMEDLTTKRLIILDNFEMIEESEQRNVVRDYILDSPEDVKYMIISRGRAPLEFMIFFTTGQISIIEADKIIFNQEEAHKYIEFKGKTYEEDDYEIPVEFCGCAAMLNMFVVYDIEPQHMSEQHIKFIRAKFEDYLDHNLWCSWSADYQKVFTLISAFREFDLGLIRRLGCDDNIIRLIKNITTKTCFIEKLGTDAYIQKRDFIHYTRMVRNRLQKKEEIEADIRIGVNYYLSEKRYDLALELLMELKEYNQVTELIVLCLETGHVQIPSYIMGKYLQELPDDYVKKSIELIVIRSIYCISELKYAEAEKWYKYLKSELLLMEGASQRKRKSYYDGVLFLDFILPFSDEEETLKKYQKATDAIDVQLYVNYVLKDTRLLICAARLFNRWMVYSWKHSILNSRAFSKILGPEFQRVIDGYFGYFLLKQNSVEKAIYYIMKTSNTCKEKSYMGSVILTQWYLYRIMIFNNEIDCAKMIQNDLNHLIAESAGDRYSGEASIMHLQLALYTNDTSYIDSWWRKEGIQFYEDQSLLQTRKNLLKIRICILKKMFCQGMALLDTYLETIRRIKLYLDYCEVYVLYSILYFNKNNMEKTLYYMQLAIAEAKKYHNVRGIAEEGKWAYEIVLLYMEKHEEEKKDPFVQTILKTSKEIAEKFPNYLKQVKPVDNLKIRLTKAEVHMLQELATDKSNNEIAEALCISLNTVKHHTKNIYAKLNVNTRNKAVAFAKDIGLLQKELY